MTGPVTSWHYTANANIVNGVYVPASDGFNLADVSSVGALNALPAGDKGLVWLGMVNGADATFQSTVSQYIGNPKLYGFYLTDEPDPTGKWGTLASAANLKVEADWIHAHVPNAKTFIVLMNMGTEENPTYANTYNPANTDIDLFGLDPYPVRSDLPNGFDPSIIGKAVAAAESAGIPQNQLVPVYQAFGNWAPWVTPSATQEQQILATWAQYLPTPAFDYAYSWGVQNGDAALSGLPALQQVFAVHNAPTPSPSPPATPDTLMLRVSEDAYQGDAQFSVSVDGQRVGGTLTASALHARGASNVFTLTGNWGQGTHDVKIQFLNDAYGGSAATDRNLYVTSIGYDGKTFAGTSAALMANGAKDFTVGGSTATATPPADTLTLHLAEDAWNGDARFTLSIDGKTVTTAQAVTASHSAGAWQDLTFSGNFGAGTHDVGISFTNDAYGGSASTDRNLYANGIDFDGTHYGTGPTVLYSNGTAHFTV